MLPPEVLYYLTQLLKTGQHNEALELGEQLLQRGGHSPEERAQLSRLVACARFNAGDPVGALPLWLSAMRLAQDLELWDLIGILSLEIGHCYLSLREPEQARRTLSTFFLYQDRYQEAGRFLPRIWANLGVAWQLENKHGQAVPAFRHALAGYLEQKETDLACMTWHQLLTSARCGVPQEVPRLLRNLKQFAQEHRDHPGAVALYLLHLGLTALEEERYWRATSLGLRARQLSREVPWLNFEVHMLLARASQALGLLEDALGFALSARVLALNARQYDLEFEATQLMCDLIRVGGQKLVTALDRSYLAQGINIGPYLSRALLARGDPEGREPGKPARPTGKP